MVKYIVSYLHTSLVPEACTEVKMYVAQAIHLLASKHHAYTKPPPENHYAGVKALTCIQCQIVYKYNTNICISNALNSGSQCKSLF